jgi:hypothetical protein
VQYCVLLISLLRFAGFGSQRLGKFLSLHFWVCFLMMKPVSFRSMIAYDCVNMSRTAISWGFERVALPCACPPLYSTFALRRRTLCSVTLESFHVRAPLPVKRPGLDKVLVVYRSWLNLQYCILSDLIEITIDRAARNKLVQVLGGKIDFVGAKSHGTSYYPASTDSNVIHVRLPTSNSHRCTSKQNGFYCTNNHA